MMEVPTVSVYGVVVPGSPEPKVAGKIVVALAVRIFYRAFPLEQAELRKWSALSFDARILPYLREDAVAMIHHYDPRSLVLYCIPLVDFDAYAVAGTHNKGEGGQLYVGLQYWEKRGAFYRPAWRQGIDRLISGPAPAPPVSWEPIKTASAPKPDPQLGLFG